MPCGVCGKECERARCTECGAKDTRICRKLADMGEVFKADWHLAITNGTVNKSAFIQLAEGKFGNDLQKLMEGHLVEQLTVSQELKLVGTGEWLDIIELREKLKHNPARCAAVVRAGPGGRQEADA